VIENADGSISFCCSSVTAIQMLLLCKKNNIDVSEVDRGGLPHILWKYRKRFGLVIGMIISMVLIAISDDYIWDVRVTGNEKTTYTEVVGALAEYGIKVGDRIDSIDVDRTESLVLLNSDKISWITVNIEGTLANVQIREVYDAPLKHEPRPANVVASRDGVIDHLEIYSGSAAVSEGEAVRKGDLLISGVRDSMVDGLAITRASGKVYAETERLFRIEIPLEYTAKRVVSSRNVEKYIIFFGKEIKVFKNGRNNTQSCDTINRVEYFSLFGDIRLPIGIRSTEETVCETEKLRYSEKEAMDLAYYKLSQRIDEELSDAQILKKSVSTYIDNDQYILECRMKCIENIGLIYEFDFEEIGQ
jgi:similar to stage IV sporulation protein